MFFFGHIKRGVCMVMKGTWFQIQIDRTSFSLSQRSWWWFSDHRRTDKFSITSLSFECLKEEEKKNPTIWWICNSQKITSHSLINKYFSWYGDFFSWSPPSSSSLPRVLCSLFLLQTTRISCDQIYFLLHIFLYFYFVTLLLALPTGFITFRSFKIGGGRVPHFGEWFYDREGSRILRILAYIYSQIPVFCCPTPLNRGSVAHWCSDLGSHIPPPQHVAVINPL